jgi:hypothetical protein
MSITITFPLNSGFEYPSKNPAQGYVKYFQRAVKKLSGFDPI